MNDYVALKKNLKNTHVACQISFDLVKIGQQDQSCKEAKS